MAEGNAWNCWPCWPAICHCGNPKSLEECQDVQGPHYPNVGGLREMRESTAVPGASDGGLGMGHGRARQPLVVVPALASGARVPVARSEDR